MSSIVEKLANKRGIPTELSYYIIMNFWENLKKEFSSGKGKEVMIHDFGRFIVDPRNLKYKIYVLRKAIKNHEDYFHPNKDSMDYDTWILYIKKNIILNKELNKCLKTQTFIDKRNNRIKGERGL